MRMHRNDSRSTFDERERRNRWRKWNEVRTWKLKCPSCGHQGDIKMPLKRLKASNLKCSACGSYLWRA